MKKIILYFLFVGVLSSCKDVIDVDLRSVEPRIVIEGTIRMGSHAEVIITKTKDFNDTNEHTFITDAHVVIGDDAGRSETLECDANGKYVAGTIDGIERRTYHLSVTYEGVEYTSTSYMPPRVEIDSLTLWKLPVKDIPDPQIHFVDPAGDENQYYRFVLSINGTRPVLNDRLEDWLISTEFVDGSIIRQPIFISFEDDRDDDPIKSGDEVTVEMQCIDKGVYSFFNTLSNIVSATANPTSNIQGGALGYFGTYSHTSKSIVIEW